VDNTLVAGYRSTRDPALFAELYRKHRNRVFRCCRILVHDGEAAADLTQDTFVRALENIATYRGGSFRAWLAAIARNLSVDYLQALNRGSRQDHEPAEWQLAVEGVRVLDGKMDLALRLETLSDEQQSCLRLFYFNGLTYEEIARVTGFSPGEVKSHIQNGVGRMRRAEARG
jgi:RNA polymerase sigma factor (sigma-70 family)